MEKKKENIWITKYTGHIQMTVLTYSCFNKATKTVEIATFRMTNYVNNLVLITLLLQYIKISRVSVLSHNDGKGPELRIFCRHLL